MARPLFAEQEQEEITTMAGPNAALKEAPTEGINPAHPAAGVTRILNARDGRIQFLMPDGVTPRKRIALVGFASSSRALAPWDDPTWAVVGMNQLNRHIPRADAWFEIHKEWNTAVVPGTDHRAWLAGCGIPVMMSADEMEASFPTWVRFPIERLIAKFNDYMTSTVGHMLAWAIDYIDAAVEAELRSRILQPAPALAPARKTRKGGRPADPTNQVALPTMWDIAEVKRLLYKEWSIGVFGIDLVVGEEYTDQKPCAEYYLGQALARDIEVHIPAPSALLKQRFRYGYHVEPDDLIKDADMEARRVQLVNKQQEVIEQNMLLAGALNELSYWRELRTLRERGAAI